MTCLILHTLVAAPALLVTLFSSEYSKSLQLLIITTMLYLTYEMGISSGFTSRSGISSSVYPRTREASAL